MIKVGIDTMGFYVPPLSVNIASLVEQRIAEKPELTDLFTNAFKTSGQKVIRITRDWQDSVCLAAEAILNMTKHISDDALKTLRFLASATETPVDASKPIAAFLIGILKKANVPIPQNLVSYQTQHACAAGSVSLIQVASLITSANKESSAIITTSDIARYEKDSNAEITQGCGAVALYVTKNPRLMELDISNIGYYSEDVDDFFRPLTSKTARVKGRYSMSCYNTAVFSALEDLAHQHNQSIEDILLESDYIVFHVPFYSMPQTALKYILRKKLKYDTNAYENFLTDKFIRESATPISLIGNTYTASTFFSLGGIIKQHQTEGKDINNKKVLIISYGSGNTSLAFKGITTNFASDVVSTWNLDTQLKSQQIATHEEYNNWMLSNTDKQTINTTTQNIDNNNNAHVYLSQIRDDDYRIYDLFSKGT